MDNEQQAIGWQLAAQLAQSSLRLARLENNATEAEIVFSQTENGRQQFMEKALIDFALTEREVKALRKEVDSLTKETGKVMLRFRELVKRDVLLEVERKVDSWPLEFYITREEFERLLRASFGP